LLKVQLLKEGATAPTVAHPGEDLGYDLYASEDALLLPGRRVIVGTGIAAVYQRTIACQFGLLLRDRSSMAAKGITVSAGVIDAGYRGEIKVILTLEANTDQTVAAPICYDLGDVSDRQIISHQTPGFQIRRGDKIAQMIPLPVMTEVGVDVVAELATSARGAKGFGSSGASASRTV
jgi:dUTP pyrophosphatase